MPFSTFSSARAVRIVLTASVLTLALSGCAKWAVPTPATSSLAPRTPGAVVTDRYVCIPHDEAADLLLWIERMEDVCSI